jgi:hypothetical protein
MAVLLAFEIPAAGRIKAAVARPDERFHRIERFNRTSATATSRSQRIRFRG